jgi:predicted O-methyltransferase YrrM
MPELHKIRSTVFYLKSPRYWPHFVQRMKRYVQPHLDTTDWQAKAVRWAEARAKPLNEVLFRFGLIGSEKSTIPRLDEQLLRAAERKAALSGCKMGGPGYLDLIYAATRLKTVDAAIETGVAFGWSSLAFLAAMAEADHGRLISIDRPYPGAGNEPFVGIAVPDKFRRRWKIIREPDRNGLRKAVLQFPDGIDIAHYDSDKSYQGRQFGYPILWNALKPGGLFISDDIQDNMAFADFAEERGLRHAVVKANGKYIGLAIKSDGGLPRA